MNQPPQISFEGRENGWDIFLRFNGTTRKFDDIERVAFFLAHDETADSLAEKMEKVVACIRTKSGPNYKKGAQLFYDDAFPGATPREVL